MGNLNGFDATQVEPQGSFDPLPPGKYVCMITSSEFKPTKNGNGQYLELRLDVIEGPYENRVIFDRLNLDNPNETAVDIAQRTLSSICRAVGVLKPDDSSELHDRPLVVKLKIKPASGQYDAGNEVSAYEPVGSKQEMGGTKQPSNAPAGQAAKSKKKPWEK